jgi:diadenosine tetraphosphate (Ap4A) HIT family hydrolase
MAREAARTWPDDWEHRLTGADCEMCANGGMEDNGFGRRILEGEFADVYLQRTAPLPGYSVAIWKDGHVVDPTQLDDARAAGYWLEVLAAARALDAVFHPAKMNYQTLGNALPHLHTHLVPRYLDDPAPERPLPMDIVPGTGRVPEVVFRAQVVALREAVGPRGR